MEDKDKTHSNGMPTAREQNRNLKREDQKIILKVKEEESNQTPKNDVQPQIRLDAAETGNIKREDQVSISSTFFEHFFHTNVILAVFLDTCSDCKSKTTCKLSFIKLNPFQVEFRSRCKTLSQSLLQKCIPCLALTHTF